MNAISTKFTVFENEALLGSLPSVARGATASDSARGRGQPKHPGGLFAVADPLRSDDGDEGLSLAEALRERYPSSPVVVLFLADSSDETLRAIGLREMERIRGSWSDQARGNGAHSIPAKSGGEFAPIMRDAARPAGESAAANRPPTARSLGLTQRQMEVLTLMLQGKPNKLICRELRLAEGTVKCHVSAVLRALEVGSRTQAALKAARLGLGGDPTPAG
jgi:DNA-binding NarL/FixJ family response regulator